MAAVVLTELLETERRYYGCLNLANSEFRSALSKTLTAAQQEQLFGNLEALTTISAVLVRDLEAAINDVRATCRVMQRYLKALKHYFKPYFLNQATSMTIREQLLHVKPNKAYVTALRKLEKAHSISLDSLLINPVQRVPRYELLLRELRKQLEKVGEDTTAVDEALDGVKSVCESLNAALGGEDVEEVIAIPSGTRGPVVSVPAYAPGNTRSLMQRIRSVGRPASSESTSTASTATNNHRLSMPVMSPRSSGPVLGFGLSSPREPSAAPVVPLASPRAGSAVLQTSPVYAKPSGPPMLSQLSMASIRRLPTPSALPPEVNAGTGPSAPTPAPASTPTASSNPTATWGAIAQQIAAVKLRPVGVPRRDSECTADSPATTGIRSMSVPPPLAPVFCSPIVQPSSSPARRSPTVRRSHLDLSSIIAEAEAEEAGHIVPPPLVSPTVARAAAQSARRKRGQSGSTVASFGDTATDDSSHSGLGSAVPAKPSPRPSPPGGLHAPPLTSPARRTVPSAVSHAGLPSPSRPRPVISDILNVRLKSTGGQQAPASAPPSTSIKPSDELANALQRVAQRMQRLEELEKSKQ